MKNLTYEQLIELAPKDRPFQIEINREDLTINKRFNIIEKSLLWAFIDKNKQVNTNLYSQTNVSGGLDYTETGSIAPSDKSRKIFTLIDPQYQKPEVLKAGQKVRIMESLKDCADYEDWSEQCKNTTGEIKTIGSVYDTTDGVSYGIEGYVYPHYCVMPVEKEEIPERTLDDILSELSDEDKEIIKSKLK